MHDDLWETLNQYSKQVDEETLERIYVKLAEVINYQPRVAVLGKTGAGKSTLCNALFGADTCPVSDVEACTRTPEEVILRMGNDLSLVDVPGLGESETRDEEYTALYESLLPEIDLVLWILKADERAYGVDTEFYRRSIQPHLKQGKPVLIVLNQVDRLNPIQDWNRESNAPGERQKKTIEDKINVVCREFGLPRSRVVAVSAETGYGLMALVDEMIASLPPTKQVSMVERVRKKNLSEGTRKKVRGNLGKTIRDAAAGAASGAAVGARFGKPGIAIGSLLGGLAGIMKNL